MVCRATDLVAAGVLDEVGEAGLAERLGVSARHLRRLFVDQVGATPDQLARSRRAHFARRLLDDTDLPISHIAFAAGFGSLRQFNRQMAATFRATPRELRRRRRRSDRLVADGGLALRVPLAEPVDFTRFLRRLAETAVPGVEALTATRYRRTVTLGPDPGVIEIGEGGRDHVLLVAHLPRLEGLIHLVGQVRRLVGGRCGYDPHEDAVRAIIARRVGSSAAPLVLGQVVRRYGTPVAGLQPLGLSHTFPPPALLARADLRDAGLDPTIAQALQDLALERHSDGTPPSTR